MKRDEEHYRFRIIISTGGEDECFEPCSAPFVDNGALLFEQIVDGQEYHYGYKEWNFFESYFHSLAPGWSREYDEPEAEQEALIRPRSRRTRGEDYLNW